MALENEDVASQVETIHRYQFLHQKVFLKGSQKFRLMIHKSIIEKQFSLACQFRTRIMNVADLRRILTEAISEVKAGGGKQEKSLMKLRDLLKFVKEICRSHGEKDYLAG